MTEASPFSDAYLELIELTMNHALESISEGGPLVPFVIYTAGGEQSIQRFLVEEGDGFNLQKSVEQGREFMASLGGKADIACLAVDGFLTLDEGRTDAIIVHAFETGMDASYYFGQGYRSADDPEGFDLVGEGVVAGDADPVW